MFKHLVLAALAAFSIMMPAKAQVSEPDGKARVTIVSPLSVVKLRDLDFGTVYLASGAAGGSVILDPTAPEGSELTVTGDLVSGNDGHTAKFAGSPERTKKIKIRVPKADIVLTRVGGTETLVARDFTLDGPDQRTVTGGTYFDFRVGATLDVPGGTTDGVYEGTFQVQVQYP